MVASVFLVPAAGNTVKVGQGSPATINYMMGHADASMPGRYTHQRKSELKKVIRLLDFGA